MSSDDASLGGAQHRTSGRPRAILALAALTCAQWIFASFGPTAPLLVLAAIAGAAWAAWRRHWGSLALYVLLCPLSLSFLAGTIAYFHPGASMRTYGLLDREGARLHPVTRAPWASRGCVVDGNEWVADDPYNTAMVLMTRVFGPGPGRYDGPIPTEDEARRAFDGAPVVGWEAIASDGVVVDGRLVRLEASLGSANVSACYGFDPLIEGVPPWVAAEGHVRARLWRGRMLLLEMPDQMTSLAETPAHVSLIDADTGRLFGHFRGGCRGLALPQPGQPVEPPTPWVIDIDG